MNWLLIIIMIFQYFLQEDFPSGETLLKHKDSLEHRVRVAQNFYTKHR